jgi:hypothetical protein
MDRYSVKKAATQWAVRNMLFESLRLGGVPTIRVLYEDLVQQPRTTLAKLLLFLGTSQDANDTLVDGEFVNSAYHTIGGNRARFMTGRVQLKEDAAWRTKMARRDRLTCTALSLPVLMAYGYRVRDAG